MNSENTSATVAAIEPLLTVKQVAAALSVSATTVYALMSRGELEPIRIRTATRFRKRTVLEFIERCAAQAGR